VYLPKKCSLVSSTLMKFYSWSWAMPESVATPPPELKFAARYTIR